MSQSNFEGDISGVSKKQIEFISNVLEERGFKNGKVVVENVGEAGDNYIATVKRIIAEKDGQKFKMIAKVAPELEIVRHATHTVVLFQNEHVMYTEILPKFLEIEKAAAIPENKRLRYPACYGSSIESPNEIILLEDLKELEYVMMDRFVCYSDDTVKLVLNNFAILHSLSYALKDREPEVYKTLINKLVNFWALLDKNPNSKLSFDILEKEILKLLNNEKYEENVRHTVSQLTSYAADCSAVDSQLGHSVIVHGDCWTNNTMFLLQNSIPVASYMIDYQVAKESSPVADILYMIFNCTDHKTRSQHYYEWIDYYHAQLDKCLVHYGLKASVVYPKKELEADLKRHSKLAFCTSALLATVMLREAGHASKLKSAIKKAAEEQDTKPIPSTNMSTLGEETVVKLKARVEGLLDSFIELKYM